MQNFPLLPLLGIERGTKERKAERLCAEERAVLVKECRGTRESERQMDMEVWSEALKGAMVPGDEDESWQAALGI